MRKRILEPEAPAGGEMEGQWLDLEASASVEVSSEAAGRPVEAALLPGGTGGWQAEKAGVQTIRLRFDRPLSLRRVRLLFEEPDQARTQEFVLRWSADGRHYHDLVRQQYNFSPPDTTSELEQYDLALDAVSALELVVVPEIGGGPARASLTQMRLA